MDSLNWIPPVAVFASGLIGGLTKTLMSGAGEITLPATTTEKGVTIWRPGWLVNPLVGGVAATVSWGLYGSAAGSPIFGPLAAGQAPASVTWANLAAAVIVGIGGAGWLSAEVDKDLFKKTAVEAAKKDKNLSLAATITAATPDQALQAAIAAPTQ